MKKKLIPFFTIILCIIVFYLVGKVISPLQEEDGSWVYADENWYYEVAGERLKNQWVDQGIYYLDETGKMLASEWVAPLTTNPGAYIHGHSLSLEELRQTDMNHLRYVGQDGKYLHHKEIYDTGLYFDEEGYCSIDASEFFSGEWSQDPSNCGMEGFMRYYSIDGRYKEAIY